MQAIILAGGRGRRLQPYTTVLPKPLMPIGDLPILEIILHQLKRSGFDEVVICTGYLHELIQAYLRQSRYADYAIRFSHEPEPLGTIGPLHLVPDLQDTFLVMNGDILTDLDYQDLLAQHRARQAVATIATYRREAKIDFGVLEADAEQRIRHFREKPVYQVQVSMGIYIFQKRILDLVPKNTLFGFDHLMYALIAQKAPVYSYLFDGKWLDIGRPDDYEHSIDEFQKNKHLYLR